MQDRCRIGFRWRRRCWLLVRIRSRVDPAARVARLLAPVDLTGYRMAVITEEWAYGTQLRESADLILIPGDRAALSTIALF